MGLRATLDPSEVGGAPLLGTDGLAIIAHGVSSPKAIKNAIRVAEQSVRGGINHQIVDSLHPPPGHPARPGGIEAWAQILDAN